MLPCLGWTRMCCVCDPDVTRMWPGCVCCVRQPRSASATCSSASACQSSWWDSPADSGGGGSGSGGSPVHPAAGGSSSPPQHSPTLEPPPPPQPHSPPAAQPADSPQTGEWLQRVCRSCVGEYGGDEPHQLRCSVVNQNDIIHALSHVRSSSILVQQLTGYSKKLAGLWLLQHKHRYYCRKLTVVI